MYDIDCRSVRVGFAPSSATVSVETAVNPSRRCNRFVLWARTVKDGKWTAPSLHPFPQRGRGRGARIGMYEYAALPYAASDDCGSESRAGRSLRRRRPALGVPSQAASRRYKPSPDRSLDPLSYPLASKIDRMTKREPSLRRDPAIPTREKAACVIMLLKVVENP